MHPSVPVQTLQEYLDYAKAKPDALTYASHGPGSVSQLVAEMLSGDRPHIDPAEFQATVDNPYLPLVPGTTFNYIEKVGKKTGRRPRA